MVCYEIFNYIFTYRNLGGNLFGHGNLSGSFLNFPKQHICNCFCEFFELGEPEDCIVPDFGNSEEANTGEEIEII